MHWQDHYMGRMTVSMFNDALMMFNHAAIQQVSSFDSWREVALLVL